MADRTLCGGGCRFPLGGSSAQTPAVPPAGVFLFDGFCLIAVFCAAAAVGRGVSVAVRARRADGVRRLL